MTQPTTIITGASAGIGRALALELARRGHRLGLTARRLPLLEALRDDIRAACGKQAVVELVALDVNDTAAVAPALAELQRRLGRIDHVVVNAGINKLTEIGSDSENELAVIQTNLAGAIATVDAAARLLIPQGHGHIVGISSLASLQALPTQAAYCASKAGFSMYLKCAAVDLKDKGISVGAILPGFIATDIVEGVDISKLPFAIGVEQAAREMTSLIEHRVKRGIVPAWPWKILRPLIGRLPAQHLL